MAGFVWGAAALCRGGGDEEVRHLGDGCLFVGWVQLAHIRPIIVPHLLIIKHLVVLAPILRRRVILRGLLSEAVVVKDFLRMIALMPTARTHIRVAALLAR